MGKLITNDCERTDSFQTSEGMKNAGGIRFIAL